MRKLKISLFFSLMFLLMAAFPCKTTQADPLPSADKYLNHVSIKHPVPFMGRVSAMITGMTGGNGTFYVTVDGSGNVTHLGKVQLHLEEVIVFDATGAGISDQDITYTAANGDQLSVHAISNVIPRIDDPAIMDVESIRGEFAGGTGRFEDATGTYHLKAVVNTSTHMVQAWINGSIMY